MPAATWARLCPHVDTGPNWRAEDTSGRVTLYAYELDPATSAYGLTGIFHDRVKLTVPFDIDIDLTEIERM